MAWDFTMHAAFCVGHIAYRTHALLQHLERCNVRDPLRDKLLRCRGLEDDISV